VYLQQGLFTWILLSCLVGTVFVWALMHANRLNSPLTLAYVHSPAQLSVPPVQCMILLDPSHVWNRLVSTGKDVVVSVAGRGPRTRGEVADTMLFLLQLCLLLPYKSVVVPQACCCSRGFLFLLPPLEESFCPWQAVCCTGLWGNCLPGKQAARRRSWMNTHTCHIWALFSRQTKNASSNQLVCPCPLTTLCTVPMAGQLGLLLGLCVCDWVVCGGWDVGWLWRG